MPHDTFVNQVKDGTRYMALDQTSADSVHFASTFVRYPKPPALHWGLVFLFNALTLNLFGLFWILRQATWIQKIEPGSKAGYAFAAAIGLETFAVVAANDVWTFWAPLIAHVASVVLFAWAFFSMRSVIEDRFAVDLSAPMTFFFNGFYVQYHLTLIARGEHPARYVPRHAMVQ